MIAAGGQRILATLHLAVAAGGLAGSETNIARCADRRSGGTNMDVCRLLQLRRFEVSGRCFCQASRRGRDAVSGRSNTARWCVAQSACRCDRLDSITDVTPFEATARCMRAPRGSCM